MARNLGDTDRAERIRAARRGLRRPEASVYARLLRAIEDQDSSDAADAQSFQLSAPNEVRRWLSSVPPSGAVPVDGQVSDGRQSWPVTARRRSLGWPDSVTSPHVAGGPAEPEWPAPVGAISPPDAQSGRNGLEQLRRSLAFENFEPASASDQRIANADYPDAHGARPQLSRKRSEVEQERDQLASEIGIENTLPSQHRIWDPEEFAEIFREHRPDIWRHLVSQVGRDLADDLTGETFMRAWTNQQRYDPEVGNVGAWLHGIAANLVRGRWRELARYQETLSRYAGRSDLAAQDEISSERERLAEVFQQDSVTEAARKVFDHLSPAQREVMTLHYIYDLTYARVGELLDMKVSTVRSHIYRGRRKVSPLAWRILTDEGKQSRRGAG